MWRKYSRKLLFCIIFQNTKQYHRLTEIFLNPTDTKQPHCSHLNILNSYKKTVKVTVLYPLTKTLAFSVQIG